MTTQTNIRKTRTATAREWLAEGERLFGADRWQWRFVCPACGHVQTPAEMAAAGQHPETAYFSCIGRWTEAKREAFGRGPGPCNYAGGGLIGLNPVTVTVDGQEDRHVFEFSQTITEGGAT